MKSQTDEDTSYYSKKLILLRQILKPNQNLHLIAFAVKYKLE